MSYGWRGILAGLEILKAGIGCVIGCGEEVKFWEDAWLSSSQPLTPVGPPLRETMALKVSALIDSASCTWNVEAIRLHIPQYEDHIRKLVISSTRPKDRLVWLPAKSGQYSTKTGYALLKLKKEHMMAEDLNWQTNIWKVKTVTLPVGSTLTRRGFPAVELCKRCGSGEDELHVLVSCPFAMKVWSIAPVSDSSMIHQCASIKLLLQRVKSCIPLPPVGISNANLYIWIFWHLWKGRNQFVFGEKRFTEEEIVTKAIMDAKAWQEARQLCEKQPKNRAPLQD